jgi:23S rRNA-/tRNA-specific pseudouridylate synthase
MKPSASRAATRRLSSITAGLLLLATTSQAAELQRLT